MLSLAGLQPALLDFLPIRCVEANGRQQSQRQFWDKLCQGQVIWSSKPNDVVKRVRPKDKHLYQGTGFGKRNYNSQNPPQSLMELNMWWENGDLMDIRDIDFLKVLTKSLIKTY